MEYQVLVECHPDNIFVASVIGMPDCVVEAPTKEEAIARARAALISRLEQGEVVIIEVESPEPARKGNPWQDNFGRFKEDPTFDDFLAEIEANRRASISDKRSE